jgi:hypothetical protein
VTLLDEIALHVADGGDGAAEPDRSELQKVRQNPAEPDGVLCAGCGMVRVLVASDAIGAFVVVPIHTGNVTVVAFT